MKFKTRLIIAFVTIIALPIILATVSIYAVGTYKMSIIEKTYEISELSVSTISNPVRVMGQLTERVFDELHDVAVNEPELFGDATKLEEFNDAVSMKSSYLLVRKDNTIVYVGTDIDEASPLFTQLPEYGNTDTSAKNGVYYGGEVQALVRQIDFLYEDGGQGSLFMITDVGEMIPEIQSMLSNAVAIVVLVLFITASVLILWLYRAVMLPIQRVQKATNDIKAGNLDFELKAEKEDEFGQLCQDFEEMRIRLKDTAEEKLKFDRENKELISNISHDLKTPVTVIKGYAEGIMDGVADTPEKMDKYVRAIYNKANEMNRLINELTLYSKIDTNRIPYNFNTIPVYAFFDDCAEEMAIDLESRHVEFGYFNYVEEPVKIIADPEQIKRVINNIVNNSLKYMDKPKGKINLRVKDVGDFIQVELEDNGKGIAAKDLPYIFDRFYRTDASRNSSKGGSGIGLSIVKKIIEEHGGKIWATSREGTGTTMYFVLRKYQEVPINE